jgi:hypothetical protein
MDGKTRDGSGGLSEIKNGENAEAVGMFRQIVALTQMQAR